MLPWPDQQLRLAFCYPLIDYADAPRCLDIFPNDELAAWRANIDEDGHGIARRADDLRRIP